MRYVRAVDLASTTVKSHVVLDLRDSQAHAAAHVPGAINLAPAEVADRLREFSRSDLTFVLADDSALADMVALLLDRNGIEAVVVRGGTTAWLHAGFPMTQQDVALAS